MKKVLLTLLIGFTACAVYASSQKKTVENLQKAWIASSSKGIVELHVKLGEKVKKGQLLFSLNQDLLNLKKKSDMNNFDYRKDVVKGALKLIKSHSISTADYQVSEHDYLNAKTTYGMDIANAKLSKYYAPFDGTVTNIIRYNGSGLGDNDNEMEITRGNVNCKYMNNTALVCNRWPGVLNLKVKLGEKVKKGDLLFSIDSSTLKLQKERDENLLLSAKEELKRKETLFKSKNTSLLNLKDAMNNYVQVLMMVKSDEIMLNQSICYAPCDGKVTKIYRYSGSGNGECKPVLEIAIS